MAKPVTVTISHDHTRAEVKERLDRGIDRITGEAVGRMVSVDKRWEGDSLHFTAGAMGQNVEGRIDVREEDVVIEVRLPWLLAGMAEKLQGRLKQQGTLLLGKK